MRAILPVELVTYIAFFLQCYKQNVCRSRDAFTTTISAHDRGNRLAITSFSRGYKAAAAFVLLPMGWLDVRIFSTLLIEC